MLYAWLPLLVSFSLVPQQQSSEEQNTVTILVVGDSLSAGYGLSPKQAWPALVEEKLKREGWNVRVQNAGVSGDTTSGGLRRISWVLQDCPDILILELGANDALRGIPLDATRTNLREMISRARKTCPDVKIVLAGMLVPPNLGPDYTREFREIFPDLARTEKVDLIPFLLERVAGRPEFNLPDGIHPNARGHEIVADTVLKHLRPLLSGRSTSAEADG
ncbi:MAG TPA: arylesterase [Acidobacteriota bacterium]|nr:arylesterase [Acidobacteriota bacterium]